MTTAATTPAIGTLAQGHHHAAEIVTEHPYGSLYPMATTTTTSTTTITNNTAAATTSLLLAFEVPVPNTTTTTTMMKSSNRFSETAAAISSLNSKYPSMHRDHKRWKVVINGSEGGGGGVGVDDEVAGDDNDGMVGSRIIKTVKTHTENSVNNSVTKQTAKIQLPTMIIQLLLLLLLLPVQSSLPVIVVFHYFH